MYDIRDFGKMLADPVRTPAYVEALQRAVRPGCTVLEIGTGTGVFALLARRWGAAEVFAIEHLEAIELARETAIANGFDAGIRFVRGLSTAVALPRRADVLISDLRGPLPFFGGHIRSVIDARERLLAPGGIQIPLRDTIRAAVVEADTMYDSLVDPWRRERFELEQPAARRVVLNSWHQWWPKPGWLLTDAREWAALDYTRVTSPHVQGDVEWSVLRPGTAHGLTLWFDAVLSEGIGYSNAPDAPDVIYGSGFFPFLQPVPVRSGDLIRAHIRADLIGEQYTWTWKTRIVGAGAANDVTEFVQSTFFALPMGVRDVRTQATDHRPVLDDEGRIQLAALELMDGSRSLGEIATKLAETHPHRFPTADVSLPMIRALSRRYSDWNQAL